MASTSPGSTRGREGGLRLTVDAHVFSLAVDASGVDARSSSHVSSLGLKKNENLVAFTTDRYVDAPLIVKGAAAGAELAAAGIFADLLRLGNE